ncbi:MAG: transposase [Planctomycetes bacterium]|nr:transposase [Planctomycetota bacterium]
MENDYINSHHAIFIIACAGALNYKQNTLIEFQNEQTRILKRLVKEGEKLNNDDRRRLAAMAHWIDAKTLELAETIVSIKTIRKWYRKLIARKFTRKAKGRPRTPEHIELLVVQLALDNPHWGEDSIADRMVELHYQIDDRTVGRILKRYGVPPAKERDITGKWEEFLRANFPDLCAIDFANHEVLTEDGKLVTFRALYAIHLETREVKLIGLAENPDGNWSKNKARQMTDPFDGFLTDKKYCIMDRDPLFMKDFRMIMKAHNLRAIRLPPKSPNLNAYMERFIGTTRTELSPDFIPRSEAHLRWALEEHVAYYNHERNHQGLDGNIIPFPNKELQNNTGEIIRKSSLAGRLNYYYRKAV